MFQEDKVLVGIPVPRDYKADVRLISLVEQWAQDDNVDIDYFPSDIDYVVSGDPARGRDRIVRRALYRIPRPSHILFIDADVLPRRNTLKKLKEHDKDIVTGVYPIAQNGALYWSVSRSDRFNALGITELPSNPFKATLCGFGIIMIKIEVFDKIEWPYWKHIEEKGSTVMDEDLYFCKKARAAGFDIWCDPVLKCNHVRIAGLLSIVREFYKI